MTEQEKREKAIEEMAQLGSNVCKGFDCTKCANCGHYNRAKYLYDAGYRKEEEVQKETASSIVNLMTEVILDYFFDDGAVFFFNKLKMMIVKEFGVEVE